MRDEGSRVDLDAPDRLAVVRRLLPDSASSPGLDRLTALASRLLVTSHAQVSLLDDRQLVASLAGGELTEEARTVPRDDSLCTVTARLGAPLTVADAARDERVRHLPPVTAGAVGAYLGVPLLVDGFVVGALCVFDAEPRTWSAVDVGVLGELASSVLVELELQAVTRERQVDAERLELALEAADVGSFDLDLATGELVWDDRLEALFDYAPGEFGRTLDAFNARVHAEDRDRVAEVVARTAATDGDLAVEYRIVVADQVRWIQARGHVLRARGGGRHLRGVAYDSTALRSARDRLARVLDTMSDVFLATDPAWRLTYVNAQAELLLGRTGAELLGLPVWDVLPPELADAVRSPVEEAQTAGRPTVLRQQLGETSYDVRVWPGPDGVSLYLADTSERRDALAARERASQEREEAIVERERAYAMAASATTRLAMLADASTGLSLSLEPRQVLETLSSYVVPQLGAWLVVALVEETAAPLLGLETATDGSRVSVVHVAHADPSARTALERLVTALPLSTADDYGVGAVVRTGEVEWLPAVPDGALVALAPDDEVLAGLRGLDLSAAITLPLSSRGRRLGALTVGEPAGVGHDRALLADLAGRAAVALDNALLYRTEQRTGITLQRSLLPRDVPEVAGTDVAVRYLPGATGAFVGGDWYQGVAVGGGLLLAMGDVMGHGMRSAARMGQLRAVVATLALEGHPPGVLLDRLSASTDVLLDLELATLLVAFYDPQARTLSVASAGHPPPLLAPLGESPRYVDIDPGPPLGTFVASYDEVVVPVARGATVVLYTDGLVENREEPLEEGLERLRQALEELQLPPEAVADHVLERTGRTDGGDDDVALLVMVVDG